MKGREIGCQLIEAKNKRFCQIGRQRHDVLDQKTSHIADDRSCQLIEVVVVGIRTKKAANRIRLSGSLMIEDIRRPFLLTIFFNVKCYQLCLS